jgi:lysophospholipase L1-like esterase
MAVVSVLRGNLRGPQGYSVSSAVVDGDGHLRLTLSNGVTLDAGIARGPQGVPGFEGAQTDAGIAALFAPEITSAAKTAAFKILARTKTQNIVDDGDSITANVGATGGKGWPTQAFDGIDGRATVANVAVSGKLLSAMYADAPTLVDPKYVVGAENICTIWGGTNDIAGSLAVTAASLYTMTVNYHNARHAAGFKTVAFTTLPRSNGGGGMATFEARRIELNNLIRTNWRTFADALVDVASDSVMGQEGQSTNLTYYADGTHPTNAGYARIARYVREAFATLGFAGMHTHAGLMDSTSLYIPAEKMMAHAGAPVLGFSNSVVPAWALVEDVTASTAFSANIPADWNEFTMEPLWSNGGSGAGNVYFNYFWKSIIPGTAIAAANSTTFQSLTATTLDIPVLTPWNPAIAAIVPPASRLMSFAIQRVGNHPNDTVQNKLNLLGAFLRKKS